MVARVLLLPCCCPTENHAPLAAGTLRCSHRRLPHKLYYVLEDGSGAAAYCCLLLLPAAGTDTQKTTPAILHDASAYLLKNSSHLLQNVEQLIRANRILKYFAVHLFAADFWCCRVVIGA